MAAHSENRGAAFAEAFLIRRRTVSQQPCPSADELSRLVLGTLPEADLEWIVRHLDGCPTCEASVRTLESLSDPVLDALRRSLGGSG
jgi:hypothetical protein